MENVLSIISLITSPLSSSTTSSNLRKIFIVLFIDLLALGLSMPVLPTLVSQVTLEGPTDSVALVMKKDGASGNGARWYGFVVSVSSLAQLLSAPVVGQLSDKKFGRKWLISFFLFFISLYYFLLGISSLEWLKSDNDSAINYPLWIIFFAKLIGGLCAHVIMLSMTYISDISASTSKAQNFGLFGVAFGLAFIIGPATGGYLSARVKFQSPFFLSGILQLMNAIFVTTMMQDSWSPPHTNISEREAIVLWELMNPLRTFKIFLLPEVKFTVLPVALSMVLLTVCQQSFYTVWVLYAAHKFGWTSFHSGLFMTLTGICSVVVQGYVIRLLIPLIGERNCASFGLLFGIILNISVALIKNGWILFFILPLTSLEGLATPSLQSLVVKLSITNEKEKTESNELETSIQGGIQGSISSLQTLSKVIASVLATQLFYFGTSTSKLSGISFLFGALLNSLALFILRNSIVPSEKDANLLV
jgi:DHA1 family tetracycline resistance protein-like MFS transporter